jgi:hypothetical protein
MSDPASPPAARRTVPVVVGALATAAFAAAVVAGVTAGGGDSPGPAETGRAGSVGADRQREVAERGREVMPFDLDRTTHHFAKTPDGGVQTVVADDPADAAQVALVRGHLRQEAERFRAGDFDDPAAIHGDQMPGLAALRAGAGRITVRYAERPDGATLTYATAEPELVAALHQWFDAQVGDHGSHAQ